jgi:TM2 domain-containing membrane protein YozV
VACPACEQLLSIPPELVGQEVECPYCKTKFGTAAEVSEPVQARSAATGESGQKYCHECGTSIRLKAVVCPKCGCSQPRRDDYDEPGVDGGRSEANSNRIAAGILGILLGPLGIHKFILGYTTAGVIMLVVSIVGACAYGLGPFVMWIIGLVEGIIYLTKSDQEFHRVYVVNQRPWF